MRSGKTAAADGAGDPIVVETPQGQGRLWISLSLDPQAMLFLGHGAGGGVEAWDLAALADQLPLRGITVIRFEQPWRVAGAKVATRPPRLDEAWDAAARALSGVLPPGGRLSEDMPSKDMPSGHTVDDLRDLPWFFGGRSAGARVACRTAERHRVMGVIALSFPLHPPGKPEKSRLEELLMPTVPRLVIQGERDPFGGASEVRAALGLEDVTTHALAETAAGASVLNPGTEITVVTVAAADHSLKAAKSAPLSPAGIRALVVEQAASFVHGQLSKSRYPRHLS